MGVATFRFSLKGEKTMTGSSIVSRLSPSPSPFAALWPFRRRPCPSNLHTLWLHPKRLARFAQHPTALRILDLLGPLDWGNFPERNLQRDWGQPTVAYAAWAAAYLLKLNEGLDSMGELRRYLLEHPFFISLFGFPLTGAGQLSAMFDPEASLPTQRHLTQMLRTLPNGTLQFLLADSVRLICAELATLGVTAGQSISLDTKHILAWVKENNPKAYVSDRYNKTQQPPGDPDCKLGCKRRHNRRAQGQDHPPTPVKQPVPAGQLSVGEYYWGYASGVVATKVPDWGEFVLAELTQPFDQPDVSYFFPLMQVTEQRLGFRPRCGAFDAAFDAFYVYDYFYRADDPDCFAAVPFAEKGGYSSRCFSPEGLPICAAGLPMPLKMTFRDRTRAIIEHERGKYVCPLLYPQPTGQTCPHGHKNWLKKGCTADMPTSIGARLRYTLDRKSPAYLAVYRQRTATERVNSQAVALGIERPHWRNGQAITNQNTLIYTLINLRFLQRLRHRQPAIV
jgi:hypothetical protein